MRTIVELGRVSEVTKGLQFTVIQQDPPGVKKLDIDNKKYSTGPVFTGKQRNDL